MKYEEKEDIERNTIQIGDIVKANDSLFTNKENMRIGVVTEIFEHRCFVAFDNAIKKGAYQKGSPYYGWWYDMADVVQTGRKSESEE